MSELRGIEKWWLNSWPHRWHVHRHVPRFLQACPVPFRGEVLEVGAGRGWTSQRILQTFPQVELTATDSDMEATQRFDRLLGQYGQRLRVRQADILSLPFDRNSFDIVIAINVMRYIAEADVAAALLQLLRVCRPGGLIGFSDYALFPSNRGVSRARIGQIFQDEQCTVVYSRGTRGFDVWVQKPYPVERGGGRV